MTSFLSSSKKRPFASLTPAKTPLSLTFEIPNPAPENAPKHRRLSSATRRSSLALIPVTPPLPTSSMDVALLDCASASKAELILAQRARRKQFEEQAQLRLTIEKELKGKLIEQKKRNDADIVELKRGHIKQQQREASEMIQLRLKVDDIKQQTEDKQSEIEKLTQQINHLNDSHAKELDCIKTRMQFLFEQENRHHRERERERIENVKLKDQLRRLQLLNSLPKDIPTLPEPEETKQKHEQQIEEQQQQIQSLEQQLSVLENELENANQHMLDQSELQHNLETREIENQKLQYETNSLNAQLQSFSSRSDELDLYKKRASDAHQLEARNRQLLTKVQKLEAERANTEQLKEQLRSAEERIQRLSDQLAEASTAHEQIQLLNQRLDQWREVCSDITPNCQNPQQVIDAYNELLNQHLESAQKLGQTELLCSRHEQSNQNLTNELNGSKQQLLKAQNDLIAKKHESAMLTEKVSLLTKEQASFKRLLQTYEFEDSHSSDGHVKSNLQRIAMLEQQLNDCKTRCQQFEKENQKVQELKTKVEQLENQLSSTQSTEIDLSGDMSS